MIFTRSHSAEILCSPDPSESDAISNFPQPPPSSAQIQSDNNSKSQSRRSHPNASNETTSHSATNRASMKIVKTSHFASALPANYVALYPYKPQKSDELELKKGGKIANALCPILVYNFVGSDVFSFVLRNRALPGWMVQGHESQQQMWCISRKLCCSTAKQSRAQQNAKFKAAGTYRASSSCWIFSQPRRPFGTISYSVIDCKRTSWWKYKFGSSARTSATKFDGSIERQRVGLDQTVGPARRVVF